MTDCSSLIVELRRMDIYLEAIDGNLKINAPKGVLTQQLQQTLKDNKQALVNFLESSLVSTDDPAILIEPTDRESSLPLSFAQDRLWYIEQFIPGLTAYNIPLGFKLSGNVNVSLLAEAINTVVSRHEVLRTVFSFIDGVTHQHVLESLSIPLPETDLTGNSSTHGSLQDQITEQEALPFDLANGPLLRASVFKLSDSEYYLYICFHHLIFDGTSIDLFTTELLEIYNAMYEKRPASVPQLPIQYADYAVWHKQWVDDSVVPQQLDFWKDKLTNLPDPLPLPFDYQRPTEQSYDGDTISVFLRNKTVVALEGMGRSIDASLYMVLLGCLKTLLYKYTTCTDIVVGTLVANRPTPSVENLMGYFANTLVSRTQLNNEMSVRQALTAVRDTCLDLHAHQDLPFEKLVAAINPERDPSRTPIFQILFNFSDDRDAKLTSENLQLVVANASGRTARTDLAIDIARTHAGLEIVFEYATALFERETIVQLSQHYQKLAETIFSGLDTTLPDLQLLSDSELDAINRYNRAYARDIPNDQTLPTLIERNVQRVPDKIAVLTSNGSLTYREMGQLSDSFAAYITGQGVTRGSWVGVCVDRTTMLPVVLLGLLKAGCTYVPLDPEFPVSRLLYMIEDAKLQYLVTEPEHAGNLGVDSKPILLTHFREFLSNEENANASAPAVQPPANGAETAYVIYTSGTTGKPKGVVVPHGTVSNFIQGMIEKPGLTEADTLLAVTTLSFDISVLELFLPLAVGATTIIATRSEASDGEQLLGFIQSHSVSVMQATPATWRLLLASGWNADYPLKILCGGEAMPEDLARQLLEIGSEFWNMYGPTETTVWSTCERITRESNRISLGQPIANTRVYIMDSGRMLMPAGAAGELCIGGSGVTQGYHGIPDLTEDRFVPDPFFPAEKMYRTGDKARFRRDESLEYLGRLDNQVKLRGYRVELGDIESALAEHPSILESAVAVRSRGASDHRLVAFVVWQEEPATLTDIRNFLRDRLPQYMIPQFIVELIAIPRTLNQKIDRKALPEGFTVISAESEYHAPVSIVECWIAEYWKEIIGVDKVGLTDNFFDLGGHSLLSLKVILAISQKFGVKLNPRDILLENLGTIARKVANESTVESTSEPATESSADDSVLLSSAQSVDSATILAPDNVGKQGKKSFFKRMFH